MRIALLSGAVKNAGDYLITERCKQILLHAFPAASIDTYIRNNPITAEMLQQINASDSVVIGGGPCYKWDLYPESLPLVTDLGSIKPKMFMMGCGWYGDSVDPEEVWRYRFSASSNTLLKRVEANSHILGCRDYYAVKVLRSNGYKTGLMTGCPAWYDLEKLEKRLAPTKEIRSIAVSDPADVKHYGEQSVSLCQYLKNRFPEASLHYFFHRGTTVDGYTDQSTVDHISKMTVRLKEMGYSIHDISYGSQGFSLYDPCDLHVGHRVHAHIYNLSQRKISVLIEEDARGAGVNEPLGLWGIKAYKRKKGKSSSFFIKAYNKVFDYSLPNPYVLNEVDAYLDAILTHDCRIMNRAFSQMESYYRNMESYLDNMRKLMEEK